MRHTFRTQIQLNTRYKQSIKMPKTQDQKLKVLHTTSDINKRDLHAIVLTFDLLSTLLVLST